MNAAVLVASREFTERLRSRPFLISNIAILAILALALFLPNLFGDDDPVLVGHLGDGAGQVAQIALGQQGAFDLEIELTEIADRQAAEVALENGEVEAVLLDATTLLASLRPTELLAGKVLGLGALGLLQILLLTGVGTAGLLLTDVIEVPAAAWSGLALVTPWYVLGYLLYAGLFAMAGSIVSRVEDMQSAVMPVIAALLPISARIYRGGVLRTRGKVSFREAWTSS